MVVFGVAMAALESAVVVYLRALYYKDEFTVSFKLIDPNILLIEIAREVATILMLGSVAYLAAGQRHQRLPYFLITFAIWDIFYYVWLKVFINWPTSLFDWDILFLIPITWLGPVLSPIVCSVTMLVLASILLRWNVVMKISSPPGMFMIAGALVILYTFLFDYGNLLARNDLFTDYFQLVKNKKFLQLASAYIPSSYNWLLFCAGEILIGAAIIQLFVQKRRG